MVSGHSVDAWYQILFLPIGARGYMVGSISTTYASGTSSMRVRQYFTPLLPPQVLWIQFGWSRSAQWCAQVSTGPLPTTLKLLHVKIGSPAIPYSVAKNVLPGNLGSRR